MGMDQSVQIARDKSPTWPQMRDLLAARGMPLQMRMIDGQLAFPDEEPPEKWSELRVGGAQAMVTLRREEDCIRLVVWGNADVATRQAWNALTWAIAHLGGGAVEVASRQLTSAEFAQTAELPASVRAAMR